MKFIFQFLFTKIDWGNVPDWLGILGAIFSVLGIWWQVEKQNKYEKEHIKEKARPIFNVKYFYTEWSIKEKIRCFVSTFAHTGDLESKYNDRDSRNNMVRGLTFSLYNPSISPLLFVKISLHYRVPIKALEEEGNIESFYIGRIQENEEIRCYSQQSLFPPNFSEVGDKLTPEEQKIADLSILPLVDKVTILCTTTQNERIKYKFTMKDGFEPLKFQERQIVDSSEEDELQEFIESPSVMFKNGKATLLNP